MEESKIILLVEDNAKLNEINCRALQMEGYQVCTALTLKEARAHLAGRQPDVILLDVMLPDGSGLDFCAEIRRRVDAHILFLTSRVEQEDRVCGLDVGGDDYITKPYQLKELLARVRAALRRRAMQPGPAGQLTRGPLLLDMVAQRAFLDGKDMLLTQKEFALLLQLAQHEGESLNATALYEAVWRMPANDDARAVKAHISNVRRKLQGSSLRSPRFAARAIASNQRLQGKRPKVKISKPSPVFSPVHAIMMAPDTRKSHRMWGFLHF